VAQQRLGVDAGELFLAHRGVWLTRQTGSPRRNYISGQIAGFRLLSLPIINRKVGPDARYANVVA
jgi:hypothetical protein